MNLSPNYPPIKPVSLLVKISPIEQFCGAMYGEVKEESVSMKVLPFLAFILMAAVAPTVVEEPQLQDEEEEVIADNDRNLYERNRDSLRERYERYRQKQNPCYNHAPEGAPAFYYYIPE